MVLLCLICFVVMMLCCYCVLDSISVVVVFIENRLPVGHEMHDSASLSVGG